MEFEYRARTADGKTVSARIEAVNEQAVIETLGSKDLVLVSLKKADIISKPKNNLKGRVPLAELGSFTRQLATMLRAGLPMMRCLLGLERQIKHRVLQAVVQELGNSVKNGASFSEALQKHPRVFSQLYISMVAAGETGAALPEILDRLAGYLEATLRLRQKIRSAMSYPAIVSVMAVGICIFLITAIIPVFADIFKEFSAKLPTPTLMVIGFSTFVRKHILLCLGATGAVGYALWRFRRTSTGTRIWDQTKLRFPIFGSLAKKIALSRFARTFATLLRNGVPILDTLPIVAGSASNVVMEEAVREIAKGIEAGESMSEAMQHHEIFPPMMQEMAAVGEQTGTVDEMMLQVAEHYDREIESTLSGLTALIEPLLIMVLGIVVGSIVIAMFLPIFRLSDIVQF